MGVFKRKDSPYWQLWLPRINGKGIRERTNVLAIPAHRELAERVYHQRMKELAETVHFAPRRLQRRRTDESGWTYVYFVSDGELVKIGRAVNVLARLRAMQTSHPKPLTVLATLLAHHSMEGVIQQRFRYLRVTREWFRRDPEFDAFIDRVKSGTDIVTELVSPLTAALRSRRTRA